MTAIPAQAECRRCQRLFVYFRARRPRLYCTPCVRAERQDANEFHKLLGRCWRLMEQKAAIS